MSTDKASNGIKAKLDLAGATPVREFAFRSPQPPDSPGDRVHVEHAMRRLKMSKVPRCCRHSRLHPIASVAL